MTDETERLLWRISAERQRLLARGVTPRAVICSRAAIEAFMSVWSPLSLRMRAPTDTSSPPGILSVLAGLPVILSEQAAVPVEVVGDVAVQYHGLCPVVLPPSDLT